MERSVGKSKRLVVGVVLLVSLVGIHGCATTPVPTNVVGYDVQLARDPEDASLLWWEKPGFNWHQYNKLMLDPVSIQIDNKKVEQKFGPEALVALSREFEATIVEKLRPEYPIVNTPGSDVLRIRAAIIDIDPSNPAINLATTVVVFVPLDMGGAAIAVEFFDSITGERLAAMVDRKTGTPIQLIGGFSRFGHARAAFDQWAEALKSALANNP